MSQLAAQLTPSVNGPQGAEPCAEKVVRDNGGLTSGDPPDACHRKPDGGAAGMSSDSTEGGVDRKDVVGGQSPSAGDAEVVRGGTADDSRLENDAGVAGSLRVGGSRELRDLGSTRIRMEDAISGEAEECAPGRAGDPVSTGKDRGSSSSEGRPGDGAEARNSPQAKGELVDGRRAAGSAVVKSIASDRPRPRAGRKLDSMGEDETPKNKKPERKRKTSGQGEGELGPEQERLCRS